MILLLSTQIWSQVVNQIATVTKEQWKCNSQNRDNHKCSIKKKQQKRNNETVILKTERIKSWNSKRNNGTVVQVNQIGTIKHEQWYCGSQLEIIISS